MNTRPQSGAWIDRLRIVLGLAVMASMASATALILLGKPIPDLLLALGTVAGAGLVNLLISPLNRELPG